MACGCGSIPEKKPVRKDGACSSMSVRAALCHTCMYAEHDSADPWGAGAVFCTVDGIPVAQHASGFPCPKGKFASDVSVTKWAFVRWYGLAFPLRLWLWATHPSHRRPGWWFGCGCVVRLKNLWNGVQSLRRKELDHAR